MTALSPPSRYNRAFVAPLADWLVAAVAIALPWSTSATGVFIALWLVTALASSDPVALKRELLTPAGGLPVLLWCLGATGMLWADVDWHARFAGLGSFHKLLMIPLLLAQFRRSERGGYVIACFFASSIIVLIVSFLLVFAHMAMRPDKLIGIPVHDDIFQNTEFLTRAFGALGFAFDRVRKRHWAIGILDGLFGSGDDKFINRHGDWHVVLHCGLWARIWIGNCGRTRAL
jgi:O-antigen ligase